LVRHAGQSGNDAFEPPPRVNEPTVVEESGPNPLLPPPPGMDLIEIVDLWAWVEARKAGPFCGSARWPVGSGGRARRTEAAC
jgi:hypothetical protein